MTSESGAVEAMAKAMCAIDGYDPDDDVIAGQAAGFENYGPRWQAMQRSEGQCGGTDYVELARASLTALSENVTEAMVDEVADLVRSNVPRALLKSRLGRVMLAEAKGK